MTDWEYVTIETVATALGLVCVMVASYILTTGPTGMLVWPVIGAVVCAVALASALVSEGTESE